MSLAVENLRYVMASGAVHRTGILPPWKYKYQVMRKFEAGQKMPYTMMIHAVITSFDCTMSNPTLSC